MVLALAMGPDRTMAMGRSVRVLKGCCGVGGGRVARGGRRSSGRSISSSGMSSSMSSSWCLVVVLMALMALVSVHSVSGVSWDGRTDLDLTVGNLGYVVVVANRRCRSSLLVALMALAHSVPLSRSRSRNRNSNGRARSRSRSGMSNSSRSLCLVVAFLLALMALVHSMSGVSWGGRADLDLTVGNL